MGGVLDMLRLAGLLSLYLMTAAAANLTFNEDGELPRNHLSDQPILGMHSTDQDLERINHLCLQDSHKNRCANWQNLPQQETRTVECTKVDSSSLGGPTATRTNLTGHVYGGAQRKKQYWPIDKVVYNITPYVVSHIDNQGIAERYWLTSDGVYYYIGPASPIFLEHNVRRHRNFNFVLNNSAPYPTERIIINNQTKCSYSNVRDLHTHAVKTHFKRPTGLPDRNMIKFPIWSTSVRHKKNITQDIVLKFAEEIVKNGFNGSQIQIDDSWETCYGSLTFDPAKFPDAKEMTATLNKMGFRVTLWVHPFINIDCEPYYSEALENGYFVTNKNNETKTTWWNGDAGIIDFTNEEAVDWWTWQIREMMATYGIDSLKFDAGETSWLPMPYVLSGDKLLQPNIYTQKYVQTAATFGNMVEVRVGFQTQDLPVFVRMQDKDSRWGFDNGLRTLVTTLFQMNMAGYPFVLPDKVGGNGVAGPPSKELFIRWLQATVFMPAIQFSYAPWDYDNETIAIAKQYTELHLNVSHMIVRAMQNAQLSGSPVNFPIWWISPEDPEAQIINDEFLLGEDILVAPVLEEGAKIRDIYLPKGLWVDMLKKEFDKVITGPVWLRNYTAKTEDLPYFVMNSSLKLLCEREDGGNWCVNGALSYTGGIMLVFTLSVIVLLRSWS